MLLELCADGSFVLKGEKGKSVQKAGEWAGSFV